MLQRWFMALCFCVIGAAHAAENSTSIKADELIEVPANSDTDIDTILTNKMMRAESGSKSKWSIATGLSYSGGTIESPLAASRPNIAGATGSTDEALLDGSISAKYSLSASQALLAGVGVRWITPLQGTAKPSGYSGDKVDADNPNFVYQYIYKFWGVQAVTQAQVTYFTDSNLVEEGYLASFGLSQNNAYEIGHSHVSVGTFAYTGLGFYDKNDFINKQNQSDYSWGFEPFIEYQMSDRLNLRSSWNLWIFEHIRAQSDPNTYRWDKVTQSVGVGISVTRDFFLYPNIQFLPDNVRSDLTTVALSSNLNIF